MAMQILMTASGGNIFLNVQLQLIFLLLNRRIVANRTAGSPLCRGWAWRAWAVWWETIKHGSYGTTRLPGFGVRLILWWKSANLQFGFFWPIALIFWIFFHISCHFFSQFPIYSHGQIHPIFLISFIFFYSLSSLAYHLLFILCVWSGCIS